MVRLVRCFLRRQRILWPTPAGWMVLLVLAVAPPVIWAVTGERMLSTTHRVEASALIVEGWIGLEGLRDAYREYRSGRYDWLIATGGPTGTRWGDPSWNYARMAQEEFLRAGIEPDRLLLAMVQQQPRDRTWDAARTAAGVIHAMEDGRRPKACNVFTLGAHAARSRLIYSRALGPQFVVGVVAHIPDDYSGSAWWQSSERTKDFLTESAGFAAELLLGLWRRSPTRAPHTAS